MRFSVLAVALLPAIMLMNGCGSQVPENSSPESTIAAAIVVLEDGDCEKFFAHFIPEDTLSAYSDEKRKQIIDRFADQKADYLIEVLYAIKDDTPEIIDDRAVYKLDPPIKGRTSLNLTCVDEKWYISK